MDEHQATGAGAVLDWSRGEASLLARHDRGLTRVDAVACDILRVRYAPSGQLAPHRSWDPLLDLPPAPLAVDGQGSILYLGAGGLSARLDLESGTLGFVTPEGDRFAEDLSAPCARELAIGETALAQLPDSQLPPGAARIGCFLDKRMAPGEAYFGFGQRDGALERRGRRLTNWSSDPCSAGYCRGDGNLYQTHPVFMALRPGLAWGLYLHSTWYSAFDLGAERSSVLSLFTLGGELDYLVLGGPSPGAVVEQLTRLTGRPAVPPLWALGYHQSRWSYGSDAEVRAIARGFRERRIPLDAIHLDIDYMDGYRVFTWDRQRFPRPEQTVDALHGEGIRAVAIVDPGVKKDAPGAYPIADEGQAGGHFVCRPDGAPFTGYAWAGESLFPDFCRAGTRRWWGDLHAGLVEDGIDGIWCDMNEPAIVDRPFGSPGIAGQPIPLSATQGGPREGPAEALYAETHNLYGLLMARAASEGLERLRPGRRPWVLTRSAYLGVQRWAATWMGDNSSRWEDLESSLPQLASMGLCGSPQVGVDIGGFFGDCEGELFARWIELGAFYPFMRGHAHHGSRPQEPWAFGPGIERIARESIGLRYRLLPYLYTLAHRAQRTGEPLLRPLFFDFPEAARLHRIQDQLMVGPQLMIAPICRPGLGRRQVELPPGTWYDFHTGTPVAPGPLTAQAPLGRIPVYVRGGSVLTLGNLRQSSAEPLTELTLEVYPDHRAVGSWTLIEDDGESLGYRDGQVAETDLTLAPLSQGAVLTLNARRGPYRPHARALRLRLHLPGPPAALRLDGALSVDWWWDDTGQAVALSLTDDGGPHRLEPLGWR